MNIRFVSWNIHGKNHIAPMVELLQGISGDSDSIARGYS